METTLGDILMQAKVNGEEVEVTAGLLLHGALAETFNANVTATESTLVCDTETAEETRRRESAELRAEQKQKAIADANREARRAPVTGAYGVKGFVPLTPKRKGTVVTVTPEHTVDRETGELKATDADTFKPKKMSKMEFDGNKTKHDKIFAKDSSGKWVHNCAVAKTYRQQVWNHFNWRKAGLSAQPEHPNAMAVQLAGA